MNVDKRDRILKQAAAAFARFGFRKTTMSEIARAAGVAKGSLYHAAESKEELFYKVLEREVDGWVDEARARIDPDVPADRTLRAMSEAGFGSLEKRPLIRSLLVGEASAELPDWSDAFADLRRRGARNVVEALEVGVRQRRFRKDLDVEIVASLLQEMQVATYMFHTRGKGAKARLARRRQVGLEVVLHGIARSGRRSSGL